MRELHVSPKKSYLVQGVRNHQRPEVQHSHPKTSIPKHIQKAFAAKERKKRLKVPRFSPEDALQTSVTSEGLYWTTSPAKKQGHHRSFVFELDCLCAHEVLCASGRVLSI
jgi:hypothetical protein